MQARKLRLSNSFISAVKKYSIFKAENFEDFVHAEEKLQYIFDKISEISFQKNYIGKKVKYRNSKGLQYFTFQQHTIFFRLDEHTLHLLYFVASKRIKTSL
jgi:hypothetical protein